MYSHVLNLGLNALLHSPPPSLVCVGSGDHYCRRGGYNGVKA